MGFATVKPLSIHLKKQLVGEINYIKVWQRRINTTSGTKTGGLRAAKTNKERHGNDYYRKIGSKGGRTSYGIPKGFAANPDLARTAGAKGGRLGKRGENSPIKTKIEPLADEIEQRYLDGEPMIKIAKDIGVSYQTLLKWAREELTVYGVEDDVEGYEKILENEQWRR